MTAARRQSMTTTRLTAVCFGASAGARAESLGDALSSCVVAALVFRCVAAGASDVDRHLPSEGLRGVAAPGLR